MGEIELHSTKRMTGLISITPQMTTVSESAILYIGVFFCFAKEHEIRQDSQNRTIDENQMCHYSIVKLVFV